MADLSSLFANNRTWAAEKLTGDPEFFSRLAAQQKPELLWVGCADSRVPANEIVGLAPGELFVHRNVANVVVHSDLNCLSVLHFGIAVLRVRDVIVCGHYGCGGVGAALTDERVGLTDNWLRHIQDVAHEHRELLDATPEPARAARLAELNVIAQVANLCRTTVARDAWKRGQELAVHGWIYDVGDGLLRDLGCTVGGEDEVGAACRKAVAGLGDGSVTTPRDAE